VTATPLEGHRLGLLLRLAETITASPDLDQVLERVVQSACSLIEESVSSVWTLEGSTLVLRIRGGTSHADGQSKREFALGEGLIGDAALHRRAVIVDDLLADPRTVNRAHFAREALVTGAAIPLVSHDKLVGGLSLFTRRRGSLTRRELEMLTAFGGHAAIAIEGAQLYADTARRRREAETLADVARRLAESHDLDTILARITEGAKALCGADLASLALRVGNGTFVARHVLGARSKAYKAFRVAPGMGLGGAVALSGRPLRVAERVEWPSMPTSYAQVIEAEGLRSAMVAPVVIDDTVEGLLYVCCRSPHSFTDAEESILLRLVDHAATAIRSARLFALVAGEREILRRVAASYPTAQVLDGICRLIESQREGVHASILLLEPGSARVRHGAAPSLPPAYVRAIDGQEIGPRAGSCGTAAHRREPVISTDIATDPLWDGYRDIALLHGLRAGWSLPVLDAAGNVRATFALYHGTPRAPQPEEMELVTRAADLTRIALEREQAIVDLRRSEEQYRSLVNNIPVVTWLADRCGVPLFISPHVVNVVGFTAEELMARGDDKWVDLVHPDDLGTVREALRTLASGPATYDLQYRVRHRNGRWVWVHSRGVSTYERDGVVYVSGFLTDITDRKEAETIRELMQRKIVNVQEAERAKLSRELHDETAQLLAALMLGLRRLNRLHSPDERAAHVERLHAVAQGALGEVQRMSRGLRPRALDELGLVPALQHYAAEYGEMCGLTIDVRTALGAQRLPAPVEIALYRIMQEALSNVSRHSGAAKACVTVERDDALVRMTIADQGCGFDTRQALRTTDADAGIGLYSIRERAALLRGTALFDSAPGRGTTVVVEIPLLREA
jgi:PAS domain S-box-containing protein